MSDELTPSHGQFILFQSNDGTTKVEYLFEADNIWLSQAMLCDLYGKSKATISEHISNIFAEQELLKEAVVRLYRTTAKNSQLGSKA